MWQHYGEQPTFWFHWLTRERQQLTTIDALRCGPHPDSPAVPLDAARRSQGAAALCAYYSGDMPDGLYAPRPTDRAAQDTLLGAVDMCMSPAAVAACVGTEGAVEGADAPSQGPARPQPPAPSARLAGELTDEELSAVYKRTEVLHALRCGLALSPVRHDLPCKKKKKLYSPNMSSSSVPTFSASNPEHNPEASCHFGRFSFPSINFLASCERCETSHTLLVRKGDLLNAPSMVDRQASLSWLPQRAHPKQLHDWRSNNNTTAVVFTIMGVHKPSFRPEVSISTAPRLCTGNLRGLETCVLQGIELKLVANDQGHPSRPAALDRIRPASKDFVTSGWLDTI